MKIAVDNVSKSVKLYGIKLTSYGIKTYKYLYIGNSMKAIIKEFSYSLSYNPKYEGACDGYGPMPKTTKSLANALTGTGSYWSNRSSYESIDNAEIENAISEMSDDDKRNLIAKKDFHVVVNIK